MKSIVSYPNRGKGGDNKYRGNCSPMLIKDLINQFGIKCICDYMCGSGTAEDVARELGIESHCYDLNRGFDVLHHELPERSEFTFWHPPYWTMIQYADNMYDAEAVKQKYGIDALNSDLSRTQSWESFVKEMNRCMGKMFSALAKGGRMAVLVGDIKRNRKLYSMILELTKPGTIENIVIKAQHNCWSDTRTYSGKFIPIEHEYLLIVRKDNALVFDIQYTKTRKSDVRDIVSPTWKDVVMSVMEERGRKMSLSELYDAIDGHRKAKTNPHWRDKIRQTLNSNKQFKSQERGVWELSV